MLKKIAKLNYKQNSFDILEEGDHVVCAISGKKIGLDNLTYWNVDSQEPYYSYIEASKKKKLTIENLLPSIVCPYPLIYIFQYHFFQN